MGMGTPGDGGAGIKDEDTGNRDTGIRNGKPAAEMGTLRAEWGHQNGDIGSRNGMPGMGMVTLEAGWGHWDKGWEHQDQVWGHQE